MKKRILFCLAVSSIFFVQGQEKNNKANELLEGLIANHSVIGVAAGYSVKDTIKWQNAMGYADEKNKLKFKTTTLTRTASIAKPMTALAVMQLVELGLINLDAPIQTYIPDYPKQKKSQITTRQLLSHTSGIDGYKNVKEAETTIKYETLSDAAEVFKNRKLKFNPGTAFHYTTYGYVVLGLIIENVSKRSFEQYMQENIWDKAQMTHTGVEKFGIPMENKSLLYHKDKKGKIKEAKPNNLSNRIPGGGFYTTLEDMLKFGNAVLNNVFVKAETLNLMRQHHSLEKEANAYGFGWFLYGKKPNEGVIIGHGGEQTGVSAHLFIIPSSKTVVVALSNTSGASNEVDTLGGNLIGISQN